MMHVQTKQWLSVSVAGDVRANGRRGGRRCSVGRGLIVDRCGTDRITFGVVEKWRVSAAEERPRCRCAGNDYDDVDGNESVAHCHGHPLQIQFLQN